MLIVKSCGDLHGGNQRFLRSGSGVGGVEGCLDLLSDVFRAKSMHAPHMSTARTWRLRIVEVLGTEVLYLAKVIPQKAASIPFIMSHDHRFAT